MTRFGKRQRVFLTILLVVCPLGAVSSLSVGLDLMSVQSLFSKTATVRLEGALTLTEEFGLRLPISLEAQRVLHGPFYIEGAIFLDYWPMGWPLCISFSLGQIGVVGNRPWESGLSLLFLNEMAVAWDWQLSCGLLIRPQVIFRDPNRVFEREYEELSDLFTRFAMIRFSLVVGWSFPVGSSESRSDG